MSRADAPITLRRLLRADFAMLSRWLGEPHVARWWTHETSQEAIERDFGLVQPSRLAPRTGRFAQASSPADLRGLMREVYDARAEEEAARRFRLRTPRRQ